MTGITISGLYDLYPFGTGKGLRYWYFRGFRDRPDKRHLSYKMRVLLPEISPMDIEIAVIRTGEVRPGNMQ